MKAVGTADLKTNLSRHLREVRAGETLTVLDRRTPIARIVPIDDQRGELVVRPAQGSLQDIPVPAPANLDIDIVALLTEERAERF